ncbi:MAG TPA: hypothetical protein VFW49_14915 [Fluviicoccus sp.]|nr:hypothetical protein [Fluviicoccus sp.]
MSKSKKPRKKYTPRRVTGGSHMSVLADVLWNSDSRRLSEMEQIHVLVSMNSAWDEARRDYSPGAFNLLGHFYRVSKGIAYGMHMPNFEAMCDEARNALQEYYDSDDRDPIPDHLAVRIEPMLEGLRAVLPEIPLGVYQSANSSSREILVEKIHEQFDSLEPECYQVALEVMDGGKVPEIAERSGLTEEQVSTSARTVAAIVYTLINDMTKPFPTTIALIRKHGEELGRTLRTILKVKAAMDKKQQAADAA